jgi:thiamine kinase-like enzyme
VGWTARRRITYEISYASRVLPVLSYLNVNALRIDRMIREFASALELNGDIDRERIYRSVDYGKDRQVFKVTIGAEIYAMKVDLASPRTGRLQQEFAILGELHRHFQAFEKLTAPAPLYLSPNGAFFVMRYLPGRTATLAVRETKNAKSTGQVFRRAGHWLNALHKYKNGSQARFWPNWMVEAVDEAIIAGPQAKPADYGRMRDSFRSQTRAMRGRSDLKVFCHGDFHATNLILNREGTHGFDFTEVSEKLAIYDIADFLKLDIYRDDAGAGIDRSGVSRDCKTMFFKLYRHPIDMEILDLCLRGRLLIDWLNISTSRYHKSAFQREKYDRLRRRLEIAFAA